MRLHGALVGRLRLFPLPADKWTITKAGSLSRAGVREYWIIDPAREVVMVYDNS